MTMVLVEAGGKVWPLDPCDFSVTAISAFSPGTPALHRRSGSCPHIQGLECTLGFKSLQSSFDHPWGSFICSAPFDFASTFLLRFDLTGTTYLACNYSESGKVPDITPAQGALLDYQNLSGGAATIIHDASALLATTARHANEGFLASFAESLTAHSIIGLPCPFLDL